VAIDLDFDLDLELALELELALDLIPASISLLLIHLFRVIKNSVLPQALQAGIPQGIFMSRFQNDRRCKTGIVGLHPTQGAEAPAVTRF
jgi:hypothetical protein